MSDATPTRNREAWLTDFAKLAMPLITERTNLRLEDRTIRLSCGFPSGGGKRRKKGGFTSGECHHIHGTDRKQYQIFIHPARTDPIDEVGETVMHELLHALLPGGVGHRAPFSQAAKKLGLLPEGAKPTSTALTDELRERVKEIVEQLGEYPHEKLEAFGKTQTTRLLPVTCPLCGYKTRTALKWIDEAGCTICPQCLCSMVEGNGSDEDDSLMLFSMNRTIEYRVRKIRTSPLEKPGWDPRWYIRMNGTADKLDWYLIDYGAPIDPETGMAVLGTVTPRLTRAESREHAIEMLTALRNGDSTYEDLGIDDDDPELDVDDPYYEDEDETLDDDPFTEDELEIYEQETNEREQGRSKLEPKKDLDYEERIAELEGLSGKS